MILETSRYRRLTEGVLRLNETAVSISEQPVSAAERRAWESFDQAPLPGAPADSSAEHAPDRIIIDTGSGALNYLARRLLPQTAPVDVLAVHTVVEGDRLDLLANRYYGDPERYWLICDANLAMFPEALLVPGTELTIPVATEV